MNETSVMTATSEAAKGSGPLSGFQQGDVVTLPARVAAVRDSAWSWTSWLTAIVQRISRGRLGSGRTFAQWAVVTQTCDLVRPVAERPYVQLSPVVHLAGHTLSMASQNRIPRFAAVPQIGGDAFADFDETITLDKAFVMSLDPASLPDPNQSRRFAETIARHFGRAALPDDLAAGVSRFKDRLVDKHGKRTPEGSAFLALREIRVLPRPSWDAPELRVLVYFIVPGGTTVGAEGTSLDEVAWEEWVKKWNDLLVPAGRITGFDCIPITYLELDALSYRSSEPLDIEYLSRSA